MFGKGKKLYSVFKSKCPVCHEGEFFQDKHYKGIVKHHCDYCGTSYQKEPAFYQGSYFVAYALGVIAIMTSIVACLVLLPEPNPNYIFGITLAVNIVFAPFLYPMSKIIWANIFFTFDSEVKQVNMANR
jgi:uncharacterized protein (DUF983 family)